MADISKVAFFTNEFPPYVYGGAACTSSTSARSWHNWWPSRCAASATSSDTADLASRIWPLA